MRLAAIGGLTDEEHEERLRAEASFASFYQHIGWPVVGDVALRWNWHLDCIAEHLEAVDRREIKNLLVNIPPGFSKSLTISVFFNCWSWIHDATKRFLTLSYHQSLVSRDCRQTRYIVLSDKYRRYWGDRVALRADQNTQLRYDTTAGGWRIGSTTGGQVTGEHPTGAIIIDDPHNVRETESEDRMRSVANWYDNAVSTRGKMHNCPHIVIMQRLKQDDLSGHIMESPLFQQDWVHLRLPMRYESTSTFWSPIGWTDPRNEDGELLWGDTYTEEQVKTLEQTLGSLGSAGQLQQRPAPPGGNFFRVEQMHLVDHVPTGGKVVRYWDLAGTQAAGCNTAGVLMRFAQGRFFVEHVFAAQLEPHRRNAAIQQVVEMDYARYAHDPTVEYQVYVEQEPGSSGKEACLNLIRLLAPAPCFADKVSGDKINRAMGLAAMVEAGNVYVLRGEWNRAYLDELEVFPRGKFKDRVDASTGAYNKLTFGGIPVLDNLLTSGGNPELESSPLSRDEVDELPDGVRDAIVGYLYDAELDDYD